MLLDCMSCGACCAHKWSWPILRRDHSDADGIPRDMLREDYPLMKTVNNRCVALDGTIGECVSCSIYQHRPQACAQFVAGAPLCLEARAAVGFKEIKEKDNV